MTEVHRIVGTLLLLAFLALTIVNALRMTGREFTWVRPLSFAAAGLLLLQYVLGFSLLGSERTITAWHYLVGLAALVTVGIEHAMAPTRETPAARARVATLATAGTTILVLAAYLIGETGG